MFSLSVKVFVRITDLFTFAELNFTFLLQNREKKIQQYKFRECL